MTDQEKKQFKSLGILAETHRAIFKAKGDTGREMYQLMKDAWDFYYPHLRGLPADSTGKTIDCKVLEKRDDPGLESLPSGKEMTEAAKIATLLREGGLPAQMIQAAFRLAELEEATRRGTGDPVEGQDQELADIEKGIAEVVGGQDQAGRPAPKVGKRRKSLAPASGRPARSAGSRG